LFGFAPTIVLDGATAAAAGMKPVDLERHRRATVEELRGLAARDAAPPGVFKDDPI
jgi:hypothetical protein